MTKFLYLKADLQAVSPLKLSSGENDFTDSDVLVDSVGAPFIPGTTLAGVIRHYLDDAKRTRDTVNLDGSDKDSQKRDVAEESNVGKRNTACFIRMDNGNKKSEDMLRPYSDAWFGFIEGPDADEKKEGITEKWCDSKAVVYDAFLKESAEVAEGASFSISSRDGVALDDFKAATAASKHDYQVVDAGATFVFRMRIDATKSLPDGETAEALAQSVVGGFEAGEIRLGGKMRRGFGAVQIENAKSCCIDLSGAEGRKECVSFSWDDENLFKPFEGQDSGNQQASGFASNDSLLYEVIRSGPLDVRSFLTIRDYGTTISSGHENKLVDSEPLRDAKGKEGKEGKEEKEEKGNPVIPGTSWAGLFRHHMYHILRRTGKTEDEANSLINQLFGTVQDKHTVEKEQEARTNQISNGEHDAQADQNVEDGQRGRNNRATVSLIEFSESTVKRSKSLNITRNAIDRFTGGAAYQKLFTNNVAYGGTVELCVRLRKRASLPKERQNEVNKDDYELFKSLIDATLKDIREGYAAIGGMTSVGGGMLREQSGTSERGDGNA